MIGKPEWFTRRKYSGWGYRPKTWQGWIYVIILIVPFMIVQSLPQWSEVEKMVMTIGWCAIVLIDAAHIMITLKKDEREKTIEAISDRNAAWIMVLALVVALFYQIFTSAITGKFYIDPFIFGTLLIGATAKTITDIVLERKS